MLKVLLKKIFDLIRYLLSIVIVITLFIFAYVVLSTSFKAKDIYENDDFHNLPENSMEVIVLGSSHAQYSFSPTFFYQDTGLYSFVLGTQCQPLDVSYLMLKEALKTQSPKVVVLEVFTAMPLRSGCDGINCYITAGYQMRGKEKYDTLKKLPKEKYEVYVNPFISSHNNWRTSVFTKDEIIDKVKTSLSSISKKDEKDLNKVSSMFGYVDNYPSYPVENYWYANTTDEYIDVELKEEDQNALNNIYDLCKENNIELILYKTPIDSLDAENLSYLKKVWDWADEKNIKYIDFVKESPNIGFYMWIHSDSFHSYINGASVITSSIADVINERNIEHTKIEELENKYNNSTNPLTLTYLKTEFDPSKYFKRLNNYDGPMLIIYNGDPVYSSFTKKFLEKYNMEGPSIVFADNEQIIDKSDTCVGLEYKSVNVYSDFNNIDIDNNVFEIKCGLSIMFFKSDMSDYFKLDTNLNNSWEDGYDWYGE